jgi:hypothetical protein
VFCWFSGVARTVDRVYGRGDENVSEGRGYMYRGDF